jgi:hypothetical protein
MRHRTTSLTNTEQDEGRNSPPCMYQQREGKIAGPFHQGNRVKELRDKPAKC